MLVASQQYGWFVIHCNGNDAHCEMADVQWCKAKYHAKVRIFILTFKDLDFANLSMFTSRIETFDAYCTAVVVRSGKRWMLF